MSIKYMSVIMCITVILFFGCTKDFSEINTDPYKLPDLPNSTLFTQSILQTSGGEYEASRSNLIYAMQFVQQFASVTYLTGDRYQFNESYNSALWDSYYQGAVKSLVNLIEKTDGKEDEVNYNSAARVLKAFVFLRLTDMYGDIPYFDAGRGFWNNIYSPKYDEQKAIITDIIKELDDAATSFNPDKLFQGDITSYNGNISLWKKAAYSLMLRAAMRMSKRDPEFSARYVNVAFSGGVISNTAESFRVNHLTGVYDNPNSHILGYYPGARNELHHNYYKLSETFINILKAENDPRLQIFSVVRTGGSATDPGLENDNPDIQKGLPNGSDVNQVSSQLFTYSQLRSGFVDADDPNLLVTFSQTQFLLAEARERGWINSGSSENYYREGIRAAIEQLNLYNIPSVVSDIQLNEFIGDISFSNTTEGRIKQINTQYYIASLLDGYESHANWRRSGSPDLLPIDFQGNYTNGVIPRRFQYPASEGSMNNQNLEIAINTQGANNWVTRVWWDK